MSSFHGKSASGWERAPLTVTACLFAGGAESSAMGRFRSSILTASSDGAATVRVSSLIGETREGGTRKAVDTRRAQIMEGDAVMEKESSRRIGEGDGVRGRKGARMRGGRVRRRR